MVSPVSPADALGHCQSWGWGVPSPGLAPGPWDCSGPSSPKLRETCGPCWFGARHESCYAGQPFMAWARITKAVRTLAGLPPKALAWAPAIQKEARNLSRNLPGAPVHHDGDKAGDVSSLSPTPRTQQKDGCLHMRTRALTRHQISWHLDFGLPSLALGIVHGS